MVDRLPYVVEPMALSDLDQVMEIEQASFSAPWSVRAYRFEIVENPNSTMLVVRSAPDAHRKTWALWPRRAPISPHPVLGYAGCWYLVDEMHICTIAVHKEWRRRGLGELLLLSLLGQAASRRAQRATLEVRTSNLAAQALYRKYGFQVVSRRKHYYADNDEDAYIMSTPSFGTAEFQSVLKVRRSELHARIAAQHAA